MHRIRSDVRTILVAPLLLGACGADGVSQREAHDTFDAVNVVADDLVSSAIRSVEGTSAALTVEQAEDDLTIEGVITGGQGWTGTVTVVGAVRTWSDPMYGYELLVAFDGVSPAGADGADMVLDGEITIALSFDLDVASPEPSVEATVAIDGDLLLSGDRAGHAVLDYDLQLAVHGFDVSFTASGEISGHDVSGWPFGLSIPF